MKAVEVNECLKRDTRRNGILFDVHIELDARRVQSIIRELCLIQVFNLYF